MNTAGMVGGTSAMIYPQPVLPQWITQITTQISFAPTAVSKRVIPRSWERIPSMAFLARHRSRRIWKRFRQSMEALRGRTGVVTGQIEETELVNEISASANAGYMRGVKRQCLGMDRGCDSESRPTRSFLETKWELEAGQRKRKHVTIASDEVESADPLLVKMGQGSENEQPDYGTASSVVATPDRRANAMVDDVDKSMRTSASPSARDAVDPAVDKLGSEAATGIRAWTAAQESSLVRSALRLNSLDGEDAALLSDFLSRAQAKRAANAAMVCKDAPRLVDETLTPDSPTVRSRRALEELDKNSPSPQKPQLSTPVKAEKKPADSPTNLATADAHALSSPTACRRSTRTKISKTQQRPTAPNPIPVRRANGTEFVFLQRTEAQELALATRRNTRRNQGDARLPRHALQALAKQEPPETKKSPSPSDQDETRTVSLRRSPRKHPGSKQVTWNEAKLVEYANVRDKDKDAVDEVPSPSKKKASSAKHHSKKPSGEKQGADTALPGTPSRKVKRLVLPAPASSASSSSSAAKPMPAGTPIPKRKKLLPKSPGTSLLAPRAMTATTAKPTSASTAKPISNVPASATTTTHKKASGIPKSQSLLKAAAASSAAAAVTSSAGTTPMVKRVRTRRVA